MDKKGGFPVFHNWSTAIKQDKIAYAGQILEKARKTVPGAEKITEQLIRQHICVVQLLACLQRGKVAEAEAFLDDVSITIQPHLRQKIQAAREKLQKIAVVTPVLPSPIQAPAPVIQSAKDIPPEPSLLTLPNAKPEIITEEPAVETAASSLGMEEKVTKPLLVPEPSAKIQEEVVLPDPSPSPAPLPLPPRESVSPKRVKAPSARRVAQENPQTSSHAPPAVLIQECLDAKHRRWSDALEQFTAFWSSVSDESSTSTATRKRLLGLLIERGPNAVPMEDIKTHLWPNPKTSAKNPVDAVAQLVSTLNHSRAHAPLPGTIVFSPMGYKLLPQEIPDVMEGEERLLTLARDFLSRLVNNQRLLMNVLWRKRGSIVRHEEICLEIWDDPAPSSQRKMRITDAAFNLKENLSQHELGRHGEIRTKKGQGYGFFLT